MAFGGHLWTCGQIGEAGGLAAVIPGAPTDARRYPPVPQMRNHHTAVFRAGRSAGYSRMVYRDYCVPVLDTPSVEVSYHRGWPSARRRNRTGMPMIVLRYLDPYRPGHGGLIPGLPASWSALDDGHGARHVLRSAVRGFTTSKFFDPSYWMTDVGVEVAALLPSALPHEGADKQRRCVNKTGGRVLDDEVRRRRGRRPGAVAAPSVHFRLPLWFFNRAQVDSIADVVFGEWGIQIDR